MFEQYADEIDEAEYLKFLFNDVKKHIGDDVFDVATGEKTRSIPPHPNATVAERLEMFTMNTISRMMESHRPPANRRYAATLRGLIEDFPEKLIAKILEVEVNILQGSLSATDYEIWGEIEIRKLAADLLGANQRREIVEAASYLDESESKIDLLDEMGVLTGEQWHNRTTKVITQ